MEARLRSLLDALFRRRRFERAMADEIQFHIDARADDLVGRGVAPDEAMRRARAEFGGRESVKEECRQARGLRFFDEARQDFRYAARLLRREPLFTLTAALSLAVGIAANTTIFSIANRLLFRDAAGVAEPGRLVDIGPTREGGRFTSPMVPYGFYALIRERSSLLEHVYGYHLEPRAISLTIDGSEASAERVFGTLVTPNYFAALGVRPSAGRLFDEGDVDASDGAPMAVLSHGFWTRHFGADATAIGRTVRLNGRVTDIVGVAAAGFQGTSVTVPDLWLPISTATARREMPQLVLGARLKPEVTLPQAAAEMAAIGRAVADRWPGPDRTKGLGLAPSSPLPPVLRVPIAGFLTLLTGIVSIVLVIACANVAGILLARAAARRREMAVRLAIGAGRARLVRQLLAEAVLLFALGAVAGLLIARLMTTLLIKVLPTATVPIDTALPLDWRVLLYTGTLSLVTALLSGLMPALQASRTEVVGALKAGGQAASDRLRMRSAFVVAQVAFSLVLIVGAGLFARALQRVASVDLGYDPNGVEVAALDLSLGGYTAATGPLFVRELVERIQHLPVVQSASIAVGLPGMGAVEVRGGPSAPKAPVPTGDAVFEGIPSGVAPGYFSTLRIPLVAGRDFSNADSEGSTPVAIVTRAAARQLWPGQNPVGQYVVLRGFHLIPPPPTERLLVVGVAGDVGSVSPGRAPSPVVYRPLQQYYSPRVTLLARTTHGERIGNEIRAVVGKMNPYLPIVESRALTDQASPMLTQLRLSAAVSGVVGLVGVLLAAIGIYGVTAFTVTRRTREIGVRMAMGAQPADVMRMVLGHGMWLVAIGAAIGLLLAAAGSRVVVRLLFGVPPLDPLIFGAAVALFAAIGLCASYVPARRATRIDAMEALRYE